MSTKNNPRTSAKVPLENVNHPGHDGRREAVQRDAASASRDSAETIARTDRVRDSEASHTSIAGGIVSMRSQGGRWAKALQLDLEAQPFGSC
jgi:hypothetical protein